MYITGKESPSCDRTQHRHRHRQTHRTRHDDVHSFNKYDTSAIQSHCYLIYFVMTTFYRKRQKGGRMREEKEAALLHHSRPRDQSLSCDSLSRARALTSRTSTDAMVSLSPNLFVITPSPVVHALMDHILPTVESFICRNDSVCSFLTRGAVCRRLSDRCRPPSAQ